MYCITLEFVKSRNGLQGLRSVVFLDANLLNCSDEMQRIFFFFFKHVYM